MRRGQFTYGLQSTFVVHVFYRYHRVANDTDRKIKINLRSAIFVNRRFARVTSVSNGPLSFVSTRYVLTGKKKTNRFD